MEIARQLSKATFVEQENMLKEEHFMQYVYGPISIQFQAKLEENQSIGMQNLCEAAEGHASFLAIEKVPFLKREYFDV